MTLQEAKNLADNGNVDAMMALARHYFKDTDNDESYALGCMYQERAAEAGDSNALIQLVQSSRIQVKLAFQFIEQAGNNASIMQDIHNAHKWASKLFRVIKQSSIHGDAAQTVEEAYIDSIYWLSAVYCLEENYDEILHITKGVSSPIAQALHGLALFYQSNSNAEMLRAFPLLENILNPIIWSEKYALTQTMELLRVETGLALTQMYLSQKNADSAYNVLSTMLQNTKDSDLRSTIQKHMSHYRKTLLGRYKYIG